MKLACLIVASTCLGAGTAHAEDAQTLLHKHNCYLCHADATTRTGPAYGDIAERYRGDPKAMARLVAVVRNGAHGGGPWHMPPSEVSTADARKMVRYILSLKD